MALIIDIKVVPQSGRIGWIIDKAGTLKCFLKSPAEQGKANDELIKILAKMLALPQAAIQICMGKQSRNKRIMIDTTMTYNRFLELLGIHTQMNMFKG